MTRVTAAPPPGLFPGAIDRGDGCVTFALYAPGKASVNVIGDFNGWDRYADPLLTTPEGLWWIEKHFKPGQHMYQFAVDVESPEGEIVICDPYARELADDAADDPPRAIVRVGRQPYEWQHDNWSRPSFRDLIMMEIHVGDFTPEGTLRALTGKLDYLADLGINAIELMPICEFKGDLGWGYNPAYFFTVEKSYGSQDDLRNLVDEAHAHGIAIIIDVVLAHTAHRHPFNRLYPYDQSPWYGPGIGERNQFGLPSLDYTKGPTQDFSRDVQDYWLTEFHIDGYRYDYAAGIGCHDNLGISYLVHSARAIRPDVFLTGEFSPEQPDDVDACGLDGAWHVGGSYAVKALLCEGECGTFDGNDLHRCLSVLNPWECGYHSAVEMVNFLESHDEQRVVNDMCGCGCDEQRALRKSALGAIVLFTMPGQPMLYHGQEWGEGTPRITNNRNTIHWEQLETAGGRWLHQHYRKLAYLRRDHQALRAETYSLDVVYPEQKGVVYHRWNDAGDDLVIALNFSPEKQVLQVPFPRTGRWRDALGNPVLEVTDSTYDVELEGSSGVVFVKA